MKLPNPYDSIDYRLLMLIPVILVIISAVFLAPHIQPGVDLRGGLLITLQTNHPIDTVAVKSALAKYGNVDVRQYQSPAGNGVEIDLENNAALESASDAIATLSGLSTQLDTARIQLEQAKTTGQPTTDAQAKVDSLTSQIVTQSNSVLKSIGSPKQVSTPDGAADVVQSEYSAAKQALRDNIMTDIRTVASFDSYSFQEVGSSLSRFFVQNTQQIVLYSFILTAIVVLVVFRSLVPSAAVMFGAIADVTLTLGVMSILQIPLTLASIATLLMLIGFSLDTDVMLTMRVFRRREGRAHERAFEAMKTGFLMNATTVGAFSVLFLLGYFLQLQTYAQIGAIAVIGGIVDFIATWGFNAGLILWFVDKQEKKTGATASG